MHVSTSVSGTHIESLLTSNFFSSQFECSPAL